MSLVRFGVIPTPRDKAIWDKLPESLRKRFFSASEHSEEQTLRRDGQVFFGISTRPLLSSILISMILSNIPPKEYIDHQIVQSVSKELSVMESIPRPSTIDWNTIFNIDKRYWKLSDECVPNPSLHKEILHGLHQLRDRMDMKLIWPYSTRKGVSEETARGYLSRVLDRKRPWYKEENGTIVSSTDVVANYLHYGEWISGDCEMKQKWYPSGLTPRTYFAQGGDAIRVSCYLRDFFNDVCDSFLPTDRYARVDGSRLVTYNNGYFFIYDLTSFTSNFHEQRAFLSALSDFFYGVPVFLVGPGLELILQDLGEMIAEYRDVVNTEPPYRLSPKLFNLNGRESPRLKHHVSGFLGVPGNLATCTYPHGVLVAQHTDSTKRQSCAGDDGCVGCKDTKHEKMISSSIQRLGIFQTEKGSRTIDGQAASYLKRRFLQNGVSGFLVERVEFLMLSVVNAFREPDPRFPALSDDRGKLRRSIASSVCTLIRSLYAYSNGVYLPGELEIILDFLEYVYRVAELPRKGEIRGIIVDDSELRKSVDGSVVFPLEESFLTNDPDLIFSERFTPWVVVVPEMTDTLISDFSGDWSVGTERACRMDFSLEKLVKFGWLERKQTPKRVLIGPDARAYFRRLIRDEIESLEFEYTALINISDETLQELGIYEYQLPSVSRPRKRRKFYHRLYHDFDDPATLQIRERGIARADGPESHLTTALDVPALDY